MARAYSCSVPGRQDPHKTTVKQAMFTADDARAQAIREYNAAMESGDMDKMSAASEALQRVPGAWDFEAQAMAVLDMFALGPETHDVAVADLSGGQKKRLGLAAAFALQPDIILLDEPTNHLDIEGIDYLVQYLAETTSLTVVMVSHDRFLIQNVCDQIMEIDNRALEEYPIGVSGCCACAQVGRFPVSGGSKTAQLADPKTKLRSARGGGGGG